VEKGYSSSEEDSDLVVFSRVHPIIAGRLALVLHEDESQTKEQILERRDLFFFSTTFHEEYQPLCQDFGPVNLACIHLFCEELQEKMQDPRLQSRELVYYAEGDKTRRTNAAFLLGAYCVLVHGWTPQDAARVLTEMGGPGLFPGFRDATHRPSTFDLSILDCYTGLLAGQAQGWYDMDTFNTEQYEAYADPSAFDMHILSPKFLAFRGPNCHDDRFPDAAVYRDEFVLLGVTGVIRLNEPDCYDKAVFEDAGIKHYDLFFDDCTMPDAATAQKFLDICNENEGMLAVHCLAGLGRTGTLICLWLMLHLGWSARESIAWCRLVRPGCIIGMQQHYLQRWEHQLKHANGALPDPDDVHLPQTTLKASKQKSKGAVAEAGSREESASMARDVAAVCVRVCVFVYVCACVPACVSVLARVSVSVCVMRCVVISRCLSIAQSVCFDEHMACI